MSFIHVRVIPENGFDAARPRRWRGPKRFRTKCQAAGTGGPRGWKPTDAAENA